MPPATYSNYPSLIEGPFTRKQMETRLHANNVIQKAYRAHFDKLPGAKALVSMPNSVEEGEQLLKNIVADADDELQWALREWKLVDADGQVTKGPALTEAMANVMGVGPSMSDRMGELIEQGPRWLRQVGEARAAPTMKRDNCVPGCYGWCDAVPESTPDLELFRWCIEHEVRAGRIRSPKVFLPAADSTDACHSSAYAPSISNSTSILPPPPPQSPSAISSGTGNQCACHGHAGLDHSWIQYRIDSGTFTNPEETVSHLRTFDAAATSTFQRRLAEAMNRAAEEVKGECMFTMRIDKESGDYALDHVKVGEVGKRTGKAVRYFSQD